MESEMIWRTQIERDLKELRDQVYSIQLDLQVDDKIRCRKEKKKKMEDDDYINEKISPSLLYVKKEFSSVNDVVFFEHFKLGNTLRPKAREVLEYIFSNCDQM